MSNDGGRVPPSQPSWREHAHNGTSLSRQFDDIVAAAELSNADDEHDPEGTTIAFERSQVSALIKQVTRDVDALERTLATVDDETFGTCERCGRSIGIERLVALPATRSCVQCAG